jgi:hypothetical protein
MLFCFSRPDVAGHHGNLRLLRAFKPYWLSVGKKTELEERDKI